MTKYKANRDKCEFAQQELEYLGHFVMPQGIRSLEDKIQAIQDWSESTNTMEIRSLLGLAGYYQRFIKGYARVAAPLTRFQSPKVPFEFTDEVRAAFHTLKMTMLMTPVLSIYNPTLPTQVTMDASGYDTGAVLEQHDGPDWHPVEFFSQKMTPINSLDDARKKELLAFVTVLKRDVECGTIREKGAGVILRCYDLERGAEDDDEIERSQDIRLLALSCIAMVIGKLEGHKLERMMDAMLHKSFVLALLAQLCSSANRIADLSGAILDELLFGSRPTAVSVSPLVTGRQLPQVDFIMQVLPEMLETRGFISHAATGLLAKCFAVSPSTVELNLLFQKLKSQQSAQRKNALAIIHHIVEIFAHSSYSTSDLSRQLATHLLINLGNAELINKVQISTFFAKLEPEFILREFVHLLHSRDARVRQAAATAILEFLKKHPDKSRSIVVLLDYAW
ncbi:hypothetical protein CBR_g41430 [Chara braunii]|uniref:Reverse transcriptase/retrotransposon-derived protein RNase H-like domain-containing protein n=1 Tax=Chara braunii TaxID=69332 RepID=A0A388LW06_CHABU|nr:hypothetical protein CBR_g41430 [Chara braunii]|eukprot:GBG86433.1 hypothetical protein CBR_g41430 [Chara braunii]